MRMSDRLKPGRSQVRLLRVPPHVLWTWCSGNIPGFHPGVVGSIPTVRTVRRCEEAGYFDFESAGSGFESQPVHSRAGSSMAEQQTFFRHVVLAVHLAA